LYTSFAAALGTSFEEARAYDLIFLVFQELMDSRYVYHVNDQDTLNQPKIN